jgi:hypothetical protein
MTDDVYDDVYYMRKLKQYKAHLRTRRNSVGRPFAPSTLVSREAGAEDFALFLLGREPLSSERARGALAGERWKRLSRHRST